MFGGRCALFGRVRGQHQLGFRPLWRRVSSPRALRLLVQSRRYSTRSSTINNLNTSALSRATGYASAFAALSVAEYSIYQYSRPGRLAPPFRDNDRMPGRRAGLSISIAFLGGLGFPLYIGYPHNACEAERQGFSASWVQGVRLQESSASHT